MLYVCNYLENKIKYLYLLDGRHPISRTAWNVCWILEEAMDVSSSIQANTLTFAFVPIVVGVAVSVDVVLASSCVVVGDVA